MKPELLCLRHNTSVWGLDKMFVKMLVSWAALVMLLMVHADADIDPLASEIFTVPDGLGRSGSLGAERVYIDSYFDPLGIDSLMRPIHPEYTWEYLDKISGLEYLSPITALQEGVRGGWRLDLLGATPGMVDLQLVQNQNYVFGRGNLYSAGSSAAVSASGRVFRGVMSLDLVNPEGLTLYRFTLTAGKDTIFGSFIAYDSYGRVWSGTARGGRVGVGVS